MENRIVDSTWLGRGRHVLLEQVLTCQTTSKTRSRRPSPVPSNSTPPLSFSLVRRYTDSRAPSFHSLDRSLVHSRVPPGYLFTYPYTHTHAHTRTFESFTRSLIHSRSGGLLHDSSDPLRSLVLCRDSSPFSPVSAAPRCFARVCVSRTHAHHLAQAFPTPSTSSRASPLRASRRAPSRGPTWSPPGQRNCMSKCQRHSVQLLTARTVNDRRRRPLSSCSSSPSIRGFYHALLPINVTNAA